MHTRNEPPQTPIATPRGLAGPTPRASRGALIVVLTIVGAVVIDPWWVSVLVGVVATGLFAIAWADDRLREAQRKKMFEQSYGGSLDAVREQLDLDGLREVRDSRGEQIAVRLVMREVRQLPRAEAIELVRTL